MLIDAGYDIAFECWEPTPALLMLSVHPSRRADLQSSDEMVCAGPAAAHNYIDIYGNLVHRVLLPAGLSRFAAAFRIDDSGLPDRTAPDAPQTPVERLPDETLQFLLASRYCDTEALGDLAWGLFGAGPTGWRRVRAICDYVHDRLTFGYEHARATRTASEGHAERLGVCRDFAHLAVAFCRCMNIPARYCTGYLGDIGVPRDPAPMDFSAWFEVFLDGQWYTFDSRHVVPRIGRILIARGRDAADVAISTTFGRASLVEFKVVTDEVCESHPAQDRPSALGKDALAPSEHSVA